MQRLPNLPEEIMVDIFSRLPAKSMGRCRCLSEKWRALLSQPDFNRTQLDRTRKRREESLLLIAEIENYLCSAPLSDAHHLFDEITIPATKLSFVDHPDSWTEIYASCDGLLLAEDKDDNMFVLNPVTREIREVPHSRFALNPFGSFIMHGFGYDSVNDDYKVVTISRYDTENGYAFTYDDDDDINYNPEMLVSVYSMKTSTWERAHSSPYHCHDETSGVFLNGCVHWLGEIGTLQSPDFIILAFDLVEEKFKEMPRPGLLADEDVYSSRLLVLDGCLCAFGDRGSSVWVMKEYGVKESWTSFTISDLILDFQETRLLSRLGQEEIVFSPDGVKTIMYNFKQGTFKDVVFHGVPHNLLAQTSFVASLISPHTLH